jgi:hypothetical protein
LKDIPYTELVEQMETLLGKAGVYKTP